MKIGILSFAHLHAESYAHNLKVMQGVELLGIADEDAARGAHYARAYATRFYPTYDALLADRPDGVIVCSENARHRSLVELAAQAGVHVMCEKPLATTLADGQAMLAACQQAGVILMTAFPMRFSAPVLEIKNLLASGELGRVLACSATNQGQNPKRYRTWFVDQELAGGGSVFDHTVHLADLLRWYLSSEVVEVYAQTNRIIHRAEVEVETGGLLLLTFADGTFASIDCSWTRPLNYPTWGGLTFELMCERGVASVDAFSQNLVAYSNNSQPASWIAWGSDADQAMIGDFLSAIAERRAPRVTGYDGYKAMEVALAAYRSAELGQPVALPLP
ncbi:MAG TPA: Gfo/Idh/MocA family oxidoreductase [Anaerolineae bacterium]|nr:Gfo/Idh/MocA family oxidoreductase [Anaerolineae bacterium]